MGDTGIGATRVRVDETFGWDWTNDAYARGTWNTFKPSWVTRYGEAMRQPHPEPQPPSGAGQGAAGRICFAGDYLGQGWTGFIDGAIASGVHAARQVGRRLPRRSEEA